MIKSATVGVIFVLAGAVVSVFASDSYARDAGSIQMVQTGIPALSQSALSFDGPDSYHNRLVMGGGFVTGLLAYAPTAGARLADLGSIGLSGGTYQFDITVRPSLFGGFSSEVGASTGAAPGTVGTSYGLHLGTGWAEGMAFNPMGGRAGMTETPTSPNDVNISFTVNHALTSQLSLMGAAEARQEIGSQPEGSMSPRDLVVGAGLGLHF